MPQTQPYQPLLLRILHAGTSIAVIGCLITGFLVYDSWDGRIFQLGLTTKNRDLIDIHGTFGVILFFIFIGFFLYAITAGKKRLITNNTWSNLTAQVGRPVWWVTLQRVANTMILGAAILAVVSGKLQDENWLPNGQLDYWQYYFHLLGWLVMAIAILLHILMGIKVGGVPLLLSMINMQYRPDDSPTLWWGKVRSWLKGIGNR
jgi:hypothetical protein